MRAHRDYDYIADHISGFIARGNSVFDALYKALIIWFGDYLAGKHDLKNVARDFEGVINPDTGGY